MIEFGICNECKTMDAKRLVQVLQEKYPEATFNVGCQNYCGPGSLKPFISINERFIDADNFDDLVSKTIEFIENM